MDIVHAELAYLRDDVVRLDAHIEAAKSEVQQHQQRIADMRVTLAKAEAQVEAKRADLERVKRIAEARRRDLFDAEQAAR